MRVYNTGDNELLCVIKPLHGLPSETGHQLIARADTKLRVSGLQDSGTFEPLTVRSTLVRRGEIAMVYRHSGETLLVRRMFTLLRIFSVLFRETSLTLYTDLSNDGDEWTYLLHGRTHWLSYSAATRRCYFNNSGHSGELRVPQGSNRPDTARRVELLRAQQARAVSG